MKVIVFFLGLFGFTIAGGLKTITSPLTEGIANPILYKTGKGVYEAARGTQKTANLLGGALNALIQTIGGIGANVEQGLGVAAANTAGAVQNTVSNIQENSGLVGNTVRTVAGK